MLAGCATRSPLPAPDDPRWVASASSPAVQRLDLAGDPRAGGAYRFLLRVPAGHAATAHRHPTALRARVHRGLQVIVLVDTLTGRRTEHRLGPGASLVIPPMVPHTESWPVASISEITGVGPLRTLPVP